MRQTQPSIRTTSSESHSTSAAPPPPAQRPQHSSPQQPVSRSTGQAEHSAGGNDSSPASSPSPLTPPNSLPGTAKIITTPAPPPPFSLPEPSQALHAPLSLPLRPAATPSATMTAATSAPAVPNPPISKTPIKNRSKNDIFNAPSPVLTPAPKLPLLRPSLPTSPQLSSPIPTKLPSLPALPARPNNSSLGPVAPSTGAIGGKPPALRISTGSSTKSSSGDSFWQAAPLLPPTSVMQDTHEEAPLLPAHLLSGRAHSPPLPNPDIRIRLILSGQYLLGIGSHSDVYLGSYRFRSNSSSPNKKGRAARKWHLCAIKRLHPDRESLLLGLDEVFVLRRLGPHPNVVRLIDVRDEVDLVPEQGAGGTQLLSTRFMAGRKFISPSVSHDSEHTASHTQPYSAVAPAVPNLASAESRGAMSATSAFGSAAQQSLKGTSSNASSTTPEMSGPSTSQRSTSTFLAAPSLYARSHQGHARSTSDTYGDRSPTPPRNAAKRGARPGTGKSPSPPSEHSVNATSHEYQPDAGGKRPASNQGGFSTNADPPRMLLLLELLPHQLSTYARLHPHRVTYTQWHRWATQLLSALAFFHARNLAHADIKKENCLLTDDLVLKVGDLGSARWMESSSAQDGGGLGTLAYSAPELARSGLGSSSSLRSGHDRGRGGAGDGEPAFGVKVDIWSAGAVLYSLAIDQPPFSRARSTIDILNRKRNFFQTEEQDRTSRFEVETGMSSLTGMLSRPGSRMSATGGGSGAATGTGTPSRHGSLRGRPARDGQHARVSSENLLLSGTASPGGRTTPEPRYAQLGLLGVSPSLGSGSGFAGGGGGGGLPSSSSAPILFRHSSRRERDGSADSMDSLASSIQNMDGRSPSALAVAALLADDSMEQSDVGPDATDADADADDEDRSGFSSGQVRKPNERGGESRGTKIPLSASSSLGLLAPASEGLGDSSPLRKGTAALLSHKQGRKCPSAMIEGVAVEHAANVRAGGGSHHPYEPLTAAGVRRTPSMPFRRSAPAHSLTATRALVSRHHSVKQLPGNTAMDATPPALSSAAAAAASRQRATSMEGSSSAMHAVVNPDVVEEDMDVNPTPAPYASQPPHLHSIPRRPSAARSNSDYGDRDPHAYAPPTPIAETEGEHEDARWGGSGAGFGGSAPPDGMGLERGGSTRSSISSVSSSRSGGLPSALSHIVPPPASATSARLGSAAGVRQAHRAQLRHKKVRSISSLSSASTAGSVIDEHEHDDEEGEVADERDAEEGEDEEEEARPYADGSPPILLPGGGRLPDAARELLRAMLETDPRRRPSAVEVLALLERL
ncbi:hypothetical protein V8E36_000145 [Tilletia maclaganii]